MDEADEALQQAEAAGANGLGRAQTEALLGRPFDKDELAAWRRGRAAYDLKTKKRREERKYERLQNAEAKRRHDDKYAAIDRELNDARAGIDWARRAKAESSLPEWTKTYCVGILLDEPPPPKGEQILREMERALDDVRPYQIMMGRGNGKTCYMECAAVYAMATGRRTFPVAVSANARAAANVLQDVFRMFQEPDTAFAQDYPDLCVPVRLANGSYRRKQTYKGQPTELAKTANYFQLARLQQPDGTMPKTGPVMATRGVTGGIRGLKHHTLRPDLALLDDLQTSEDAENPEQVEKLLNIIRKDVLNLSGKGKLAALMTATPIAPDDLAERLQQDPFWKTTVWPSVISWPKDLQDKGDKGLWGRYFRMYDSENADDAPHDGSLRFYEEHRAEMDEGADVFNPGRFLRSDGHVSALQALLERRHAIGDAAFQAEYQMKPRRYSFQLDVSPSVVRSRANDVKKLEVPDGYVLVAAATDLNVSYAVTTAVTAFRPDMTAHVLFHETQPCRIDGRANDAEYGRAVVAALKKTAQRLKGLGLKLDGWAIDASGRPWDVVCSFARSPSALGLPACAFAGRSAHVFNPFVRSRLRDALGRTVLCGDAAEHLKPGSGQRYVFFDADYYKEAFQKAVASEAGAPGACSLYDGDADEHADFAVQCCNERLVFVKHMQDGRSRYEWKTSEPHDYLDCMSMCYAVAASKGITGASAARRMVGPIRNIRRRPRIRVV